MAVPALLDELKPAAGEGANMGYLGQMLCVRSCNPLAALGPVTAVNSSIRCTKALPGNELSHLTVTRNGLVAYEGDDIWPGAIFTLAECNLGDNVFAELGGDATLPHIWPLFEVCEVDEFNGLTEFELACEVAKLSQNLPSDTPQNIWDSSERLWEHSKAAKEQFAIEHARYFLRLLREAGKMDVLPWPPGLKERVCEVFGES